MMTIGQALARRGDSGVPLPVVYPSLAARGANICKSQLTLLVAPPSGGKTLLALNLLTKLPKDVSILAFLLDGGGYLVAGTKLACCITGDVYADVKASIMDGDDRYLSLVNRSLPNLFTVFHASGLDDVQREINAHEQRFGLPPDVVLIDVLGSIAGQYDDEWGTLKAMTLELDSIAQAEQCAVIAAHHTTDLVTTDPAERTKILGKITQYPRLVLSVGFNADTGEYKIAVVKNSEGKTDAKASDPLVLWADPATMRLGEDKAPVTYQAALREGGFG